MDSCKSHLIFDGGFASQLVKEGHDCYGDPLWSARLLQTNPDVIKNVHKKFLEAGADAVISSSYQASIDGFMKFLECTKPEAEEYMRLSASLVKQACQEFWEEYTSANDGQKNNDGRVQPMSVASLGPYGACLLDGSEYRGDYVDTIPQNELTKFHKERLDLLAPYNLDLYLFETFPALAEVKAVLPLMKEYNNLKFAVSFTCKDDDERNVCHGESYRECVEFLENVEQVVAVGINCSSPEYVSGLLESIKGVTSKNILVMANSGEYWNGQSKDSEKRWLPNNNVKEHWEYAKEWKQLGANWIGGCCRIYASDIRKIRDTLNCK